MSIERIIYDVLKERARQDELWGIQEYELCNVSMKGYKKTEEYYRHLCEEQSKKKKKYWYPIVLEEFYEACAADNLIDRRKELIETIAVLVHAVQNIDSKLKEDHHESNNDPNNVNSGPGVFM